MATVDITYKTFSTHSGFRLFTKHLDKIMELPHPISCSCIHDILIDKDTPGVRQEAFPEFYLQDDFPPTWILVKFSHSYD